jgi:hypothetical protein
MDKLKFRRQYLFSPKKSSELEHWKMLELKDYYLYTHPDSEITKVCCNNLDLILIGNIIDPKLPDITTDEILENISSFNYIDELTESLYGLVGRFVLIINKKGEYLFFNDACGLKHVFYTECKGSLYVASQPLLLKLVCDVREGVNYQEYYSSKYVKSNLEHWIPSGVSLYENVYHLVPNHYLTSNGPKQVRYWPVKRLKKQSLESSMLKFSDLLEKTMLAANKKYKLAITLTAGWDSRILLSSCKAIHEELWFYTLKYRDLNLASDDISIPYKISSNLGLKHTVIDCNKPLDDKFGMIYKNNTDIAHADWGQVAHGMSEQFPTDRIAVKGNCSEVGRCFYWPQGKHSKITIQDFLNIEFQWENISFIKSRISEWYEELSQDEVNFGYDLYDLFYWEHRMGSWQAQSQLEWDIVQDAFTPFNNRELLDILLSVDPKYRCKPEYSFLKKIMENSWPEVLCEPINPSQNKGMAKYIIKSVFVKFGVLSKVRHLKRLIKSRGPLN